MNDQIPMTNEKKAEVEKFLDNLVLGFGNRDLAAWLLAICYCLVPACLILFSFSQGYPDQKKELKVKRLLELTAFRVKTITCLVDSTTTSFGKSKKKTMKVYAKQPSKLRVEFLSPSSLKGSFIVSDGTFLWRYFPDFKKARKVSLKDKKKDAQSKLLDQELGFLTELVSIDPKSFWDRFQLSVQGEEKFKGADVYVVELTEKNKTAFSPIQKLWIEKQSGLALKVMLTVKDTTEVLEFQEMKVNETLDNSLFIYKGNLF